MLFSLALSLSIPGASAAELNGDGVLGDAVLSGSERFEIRYRQSEDLLPGFEDYTRLLDYIEQVNRLTLLLNAPLEGGGGRGSLQIGLQVDQTALMLNRYYLDDELQYERDLLAPDTRSIYPDLFIGLEKLSVTTQARRGAIQLGDGYVSFGRGIALNIIRNTDIDIDTSLRGLLGTLRGPSWELQAVSGLTNPQQVAMDNPNLNIDGGSPHAVTGVSGTRFGVGPANLGVHGVAYTFGRGQEELSSWERYGEPVDALVGGVSAELFGVGGLDWYFEGDWFQYRSTDLFQGEEIEPGYALYGSAAAYLGSAVLLVEARHNVNSERLNTYAALDGYEVSTGPTLEYERVITEDSSAAVNSNDITGGRVHIFAMGTVTPRASIAAFRDRELGGLHFNQTPETIVHPIVGLDSLGEHVQVLWNGGYRVDVRDGGELAPDQLVHTDLAFKFPAGPVHAELATDLKWFMWGDNVNQQADFLESATSLSARTPFDVTLVLYQDYSNNPLVSSTGNLADKLYGAVELQWQPGPATTLKAFYGAYKAGLRCAGGQCRTLPGFEGGRVSVVTSF